VSRTECSDTVYSGIVPQDLVYIALSSYKLGKNVGEGGRKEMVNTTPRAVPTGFIPPS
jgi:hypothetical protein